MRTAASILVLINFLFSPPSFAADACKARADAIPLCTLLADAAKYDGKEVTVSAEYYMGFHGSLLSSTDCPKLYVNFRRSPDYKADKQASAVMEHMMKKEQSPIDIVLKGKFWAAKKEHCFGQICAPHELEEHELLCAGKPNTQ